MAYTITDSQRAEIVSALQGARARIVLDDLIFIGLGVWWFTSRRKKKARR